jgi:4-amino-4-deoxy-L-arabinose transferase-like glycosyltransferase
MIFLILFLSVALYLFFDAKIPVWSSNFSRLRTLTRNADPMTMEEFIAFRAEHLGQSK